MGGCQVGGLAGATSLYGRNPGLIVVSSPSQRPRPSQVISQSVLCGRHRLNSSFGVSYVAPGRSRMVGQVSWDMSVMSGHVQHATTPPGKALY